MKNAFGRAALLLSLAAMAGAAPLQDWSHFELKKDLGTYADEKGSSVKVAQVDGPAGGQKAVHLSADLAQWGGMWARALTQDLSQATALRFKAKAKKGGQLLLSLMDAKQVQVDATVLVLGGDWQEFTVPLSLFKKSAWQMPEAPKDGVFDAADLKSLNLSPRAVGKSEFTVGPISTVSGKVEAQTGLQDGTGPDGALKVQDFEAIETAYGTFQDDKTPCKVTMKVVDDPDKKGGQVCRIDYKLDPKGWGGAWMRAGQTWGGQDWSGGKTLKLRVRSDAPVDLELAFNDANQNAYTAPAVHYDGKGWQTLAVPMAGFHLNEYYQPPESKKGAPLDLGRIESFNIGVKSSGSGRVYVDDVVLYKR